MTTKRRSTNQTSESRAAANTIKENNTNNATAEQPTEPTELTEPTEPTEQATEPTEPTEPDTLCTIGDTPIKIGDTIRLKADTTNGAAFIEVNPADDTRNPDKPNGWRVDTREAYKTLLKACIGLKVQFTFTDDRRATITEMATLTGCGMDSTNDRATFTLSTGRKVASGYCFKVLGYDPDRHTNRNTEHTEAPDDRPAALIRADIADIDKRIEKLQTKREALKKALTKALEIDLAAVKSTLELHPTDRVTLYLASCVPMADRIPQNVWEALQAMPTDNPVYCAMMAQYDSDQIELVRVDPAKVANADSVLSVMAEKGLKLMDISTDILPD